MFIYRCVIVFFQMIEQSGGIVTVRQHSLLYRALYY